MRAQGMWIFLCWILLFVPLPILAQDEAEFDPVMANQTLDKLSIKLSIENLDSDNLEKAIEILTDFQGKAEQCVAKTEAEIKLIDEQLAAIVPGAETGTSIIADKTNLEHQKNNYAQRLSNCRLYLLRSREATTAFRETVQKLVATELRTHKPTFIQNIEMVQKSVPTTLKNIDWNAFSDRTGIVYWNVWILSLFIFFFASGLYIGYKSRKFFFKLFKRNESTKQEQPVLKIMIKQKPSYWMFASAGIFSLLFFQLVSYFYIPLPYFALIALAFIFFIFYLILISFLVSGSNPAIPVKNLSGSQGNQLIAGLKLLGFLQITEILVPYIFQPEHVGEPILNLIQTIFIVVKAISFSFVLLRICQAMGWTKKGRAVRVPIYTLTFCGLAFIIATELIGYVYFSKYLLNGLIFSLLLFFIIVKIYSAIDWIFDELEYSQNSRIDDWRTQLGIKKQAVLFEIVVLRLMAFFTLWICFFGFILYIWKLNDLLSTVEGVFITGFKVSDVFIAPSRMILGLIIFVFLHFLLRYVRTTYVKRPTNKTDKSAREELATIFGYTSVGLSLIFCLMIAGVNFTGLAIVTGALSVGIGFGLQTIVNNFVSGLILLIERPIKTGDRVMVGNTEGYVKKISIRATRIQTPRRADVIVPNAELITSQVTNYMLTDTYGQIEIVVGVAYGSDVDKVKDILMSVASEHPEIVHEDNARKVLVLLKQFGESSLDFVLSCIIKDINLKNIVLSDLHFAILRAFSEHKIVMPFPQRDIHITELIKHDLDEKRDDKNDSEDIKQSE